MEHITTEPVSNLLYNQENLSRYLSGHFCPVALGETLKNGRYRVVHKLGWGGFATVWLARDEKHSQWVALKLTTAQSSLRAHQRTTLSDSQIRSLQDILDNTIDSFEHRSPAGAVFICSAYTLLGPSVDAVVCDYHDGGEALAPDIIVKLAVQLLRIVARAHNAGVAHGDISGANVVFEVSRLQDLDEADLLDIVGRPETAKIVLEAGHSPTPTLPTHIVGKATWDGWVDEDEENIRLIDWNQAFDIARPSKTIHQPHDLKAPESILTGNIDHRSDLWQVGCTIYSLIFAARPFQTLGDDGRLLEQMDNFVEPFPRDWRPTDHDRSSGRGGLPTDSPYESKLEYRFRELVDEPELARLLPVIRSLMRIRPEQRVSAEEALQMLETE